MIITGDNTESRAIDSDADASTAPLKAYGQSLRRRLSRLKS